MIRTFPLITGLFLVFAIQSSPAEDWYRSSPAGIPGNRIPGAGPLSEGWSLQIDRDGPVEIRFLYHEGTLQGATAFLRENGRLMAREERDPTGTVVSRVEYAYDAGGNPRAVFIDTDALPETPAHVLTNREVNPDGDIRRITDGRGDDWVITDLNESRSPVHRVSLESGAVVSETIWTRDEENQLREEIRRQGDTETRGLYDQEGRLVEERVTRGGILTRLRTYFWSDSNLIRVEERGEGRLSIREIGWNGDRMVREVRSIDGVTVSEIEWTSEDERVETLYRGGEAVIRIYWTGDNRIREDFLKEGEVVRSQGGRG